MPNKSANVAFSLDYQMTDSDRTVFGHMTNWLGTYFEDGAQTYLASTLVCVRCALLTRAFSPRRLLH